MKVQPTWFEHIRAGRKTVEGRKASATWSGIKQGDTIVFMEDTADAATVPGDARKCTGAVLQVRHYAAGPDALTRFLCGEAKVGGASLEHLLPGITTLPAAEAVYLGLPGWTEETIDGAGMLAIEFKAAQ